MIDSHGDSLTPMRCRRLQPRASVVLLLTFVDVVLTRWLLGCGLSAVVTPAEIALDVTHAVGEAAAVWVWRARSGQRPPAGGRGGPRYEFGWPRVSKRLGSRLLPLQPRLLWPAVLGRIAVDQRLTHG